MLQFYIGFSYTRRSLISKVIRVFTRSEVSHVFLMVVNGVHWAKVFHLDEGKFEILEVHKFMSPRRVVTDVFEIPVTDRKAGSRATLWFGGQPVVKRLTHNIRMAVEWLFKVSITRHPVRYCTEGVAIFLLKAGVPSMVEATERVVSPGEMKRWVIDNNWKRVYGENLPNARGSSRAR